MTRAKYRECPQWLEKCKFYDGDECLIWPFAKDRYGYGRLTINRKSLAVHREVCAHFNGPPPTAKHDAAHTCGRGSSSCCTGRHLAWKTRTENEADKIIHGTSNRGERQGGARLTEEQVLAIRATAGLSQSKLAAQYGVHRSTIQDIQKRRRWAWLEDSGT